MNRRTLRGLVRNERGTAVLLALGFMVFLLAMAGFAVDLAYQMAATGEIERSMEAAALAGAGKLGFNDTVFPTVRDWAVQYAGFNTIHKTGNMVINSSTGFTRNDPNSPDGSVVLGIWNGSTRTFAPSTDGTQVNAVRCQWQTTVPTMFLRVLGIQSLPVSAQGIAVANPNQQIPPNACPFPVGMSSCFFGGATSAGCGSFLSLISSSDNSAVGANTGAWVSLTACPNCNVNTNTARDAIQAAAAGACPPAGIEVGDTVGANNGMLQNAYDAAYDAFINKYNEADPATGLPREFVVYQQDGVTEAYRGRGWEVYVPVIDTGAACPPGSVNGNMQIVGFSKLIIAQVRKQNGQCAVANHFRSGDNPWDSKCFSDKNGTATSLDSGTQGQRAIYGYYNCGQWMSPPTDVPVPRTSLSDRLRLVKTY